MTIHGSSSRTLYEQSQLAAALDEVNVEGTLYFGYPIVASKDDSVSVDAVLLSNEYGLVAFNFDRADGDYREHYDRLAYLLKANLAQDENLRRRRELAVPVNVIAVFPEGATPSEPDEEYLVATMGTLRQALERTDPVPDPQLFRKLTAALQRVNTIHPRKRRANVAKAASKGATIKQIEKQIANLDVWQNQAAIETPNGPQRIRGLAGSGKTVVLALKAAYLHRQHPEWNIAVTFHSRSLYEQFRDLIERFTYQHSQDKPNWERLQILHSWGSAAKEGFYSLACSTIDLMPISYLAARQKYGAQQAFSGACDELAAALKGRDQQIFDAILIDEAQDLPTSFFQIADAIAKEPKRIIWAYDELQNLSQTDMASPREMFARDISLENVPNEPLRDITLPVCYRNTPWALTLAHALGFGLFREEGIVQHFDHPQTWEAIGYRVTDGQLNEGSDVTLTRAPTSYPEFFTDLLAPAEAVKFKSFQTKAEQYSWIAEQIKSDIEDEELDPDDVLVVLADPLTQKSEFYELRRHLVSRNIAATLAGVTSDRDTFAQAGTVTVSGVYRAKGNEAPMVYVANADACAGGSELIKLRNILFTSITRSRAWVRICGVGPGMNTLSQEIQAVVDANYDLHFTVPTRDQRDRMRRINRDRTEEERRVANMAARSVEDLLRALQEGQLSPDEIPHIQELIREIQRRSEAE